MDVGRPGVPTLWRPAEPAFWIFAGILVVTGVLTVAEQSVFRQISASGWFLAWILVVVYALPVFLVVFTLDLFERQSVSLVIGALLWGAIAATTLAAIANAGWSIALSRVTGPDFAARWVATLTAPWVEETLKACGLVLLVLIASDGFEDLLDGFVYGAMCGLGFAIVEDVFYFMGVFGGSPGAVLAGFFIRIVGNGPYGHLLFTALTGMGIAYFVTRRGRTSTARRVLVGGGLILLGVFAHFLWNSPWLDLFPRRPWTGTDWILLPIAALVKAVPFLLVVVLMIVLARRRERRWVDLSGSSELSLGGMTETEARTLRSPRARRRAVREMRARAGRRAARLLKRLQHEQINLAMLRARISIDDPAVVRQRAYCRSLRDALAAMPAAMPAG